MLTNDQDEDKADCDQGENQEKKIDVDIELNNESNRKPGDDQRESQTAVLAWTAARLLALPVEVSMLQVERPFLGPPRGKATPRP